MQKTLISIGLILVVTIIILFQIDNLTARKVLQEQIDFDRKVNEQVIEELRKEIRLLKQDYLILENGFTEEEE